jgi:hypothetical protein
MAGRSRRAFMAWVTASVLAMPLLSAAAPARKAMPVELKHVSVAAGANVALGTTLRSGVEAELSRSDFGPPPFARKYSLSASLVKLEPTGSDGARRVTAVVGIVLYDERDSIIASINGRASAEGGDSSEALSHDALLGAVHSAVKRVPSAIKQVERR